MMKLRGRSPLYHNRDRNRDRIRPTVLSVVRAGATNPTDATTVQFTVTFSESVTGVGTADFTLTTTGVIAGAAITSVAQVSPSVYTVNVNTGTGDGTIKVNVLNDGTIRDLADKRLLAPFTTGEVYIIDKAEAEPPPPEPESTRPLWVNLPEPDEWNGSTRLKMLVDCMLMSRVIDGNPVTEDSKFRVLTTSNRLADFNDPNSHYGSRLPSIQGTYLLDCDWLGTVGTIGAAGASVQNVVTVGQHTTADIVITSDEINLDLNFSQPLNGLPTLLRPGYPRGTTQLTTNEFRAFMEPFAGFRAMGMQKTNWSSVEDTAERETYLNEDGELDWSARPNTTDSWNRLWGAPIEGLVEVANECGKDLWLCVPHVASDDYLTGLFTYLEANLDAELNCYIEWSNELWNFSAAFHQGGHLKDMAAAYIVSGADPQIDVPDDNEYYELARYSVKRTIDSSNIARGIFGNLNRMRHVMCSQYANPSYIANALSWAESTYPQPPSYYLWGLGCAPYVGAGTGTAAQILSDIRDDFEDRATWADGGKFGWWRGIADNFSLNLVLYEAGIDMGQSTTNLTNKIAAAYHADAQALIKDYYDNCYSNGVVFACHFLGICTRDKDGPAWGLAGDVEQLDDEPMYQGAVDFTQQEPLTGGLRARFYENTDFTGLISDKTIPVWSHRYVGYSTTPPESHPGEEPTAPNNQSIRINGVYTVQPGIVALYADKEANDTATLTLFGPFSRTVAFQIDHVAQFSGNGIAYGRLLQEDALGNRTPVPQNACTPA